VAALTLSLLGPIGLSTPLRATEDLHQPLEASARCSRNAVERAFDFKGIGELWGQIPKDTPPSENREQSSTIGESKEF